jgi:hypothetical protein
MPGLLPQRPGKRKRRKNGFFRFVAGLAIGAPVGHVQGEIVLRDNVREAG